MKILAIRGKNLASLSLQFEIDFQKEPLLSAGLYAITGATGSGKSTILDALCLALYERTPRLSRATSKGEAVPDIGSETVTPSDPRTILRRGAGDGFAEVDFIGSDGVSYRARWKVWRARSHAEGKLQSSEVTLTRLHDGQLLGERTKSATLKLIESCIGLSFDQFTRAVLLAQNEFASFLKAQDDERAELLQTLTGTQTFSDLSKLAFERMRNETATLTHLKDRLKDEQPLSPEARAALERDLRTATDQKDALLQKKLHIEEHLRWHQQWLVHQSHHSDAQAQLEAAVAADQIAAPRHDKLSLWEQVQPAAVLANELQRLKLAVQQALDSKKAATAALFNAQAEADDKHNALLSSQRLVVDADAAKQAAQADIDRARALDGSINALNDPLQTAQKALSDTKNRRDSASAVHSDVNASLNATTQQRSAAESWLALNTQWRTLALSWQRWEALLGQGQTLLQSQRLLKETLSRLALAASSNAVSAAAAQNQLRVASERSETATRLLASLSIACGEVDADQLAIEKQKFENQRNHLQEASALWQRHNDAHAKQMQLTQQQKSDNEALVACEAELSSCSQSQLRLEGELQGAEKAFDLAKMAASEGAELLRTRLQIDQPCPVCGALDHPYSDHSPLVDGVLKSLEERVISVKEMLRVVNNQIAQATAAKAVAQSSLRNLSLLLAESKSKQVSINREWATLTLRSVIDAVPESQRVEWLSSEQVKVRDSLARISATEAAHRDNLRRRDSAQNELNIANNVLRTARDRLTELSEQSTRTTQAIASEEGHLASQIEQLEGIESQLDEALNDSDARDPWRKNWHSAPEMFVAQCRNHAVSWMTKHDQVLSSQRSIDALLIQLASAEKALKSAVDEFASQELACKTMNSRFQGFRNERAQLFEGRPLKLVEAALNTAISQASTALESARAATQAAQVTVSRHEEAERQAKLHVEQHESALGEVGNALSSWLLNFNQSSRMASGAPDLSLARLKELLDISQADITKERDSLQELKHRVSAAQAVLTTRRQSLSDHESRRATTDSAEALQEELQVIANNLNQASSHATSASMAISRDDERLLASTSLINELGQQEAITRVWLQLGDLIGSADGKKFRNFAQQLTLDILLGYGNRHLQSLSSRYKLLRVKSSLGLLVVDQDMGDEVRSVHSLSGGESFLVSLAMALGLASLSSHRVKVESLFIDEGFGSLDADSLRVAMDALDNLQAQGRKVGVISHVPEMTERIGTRVQVERKAGGSSRIVVL